MIQISPYKNLTTKDVIDLDALAVISESIPGMISSKVGQFLYSLCYMQDVEGDVVEIGSWQGRSTSFLARAVKESCNGEFLAIDHFKGNEHSKKHYQIGKEDLSDLEEGFKNNMMHLGLNEDITLLNMPNDEAVKLIQNRKIRFLFIDGDYSLAGVSKDVSLFFPLLIKGSIIVFDDFAPECDGVVKIADILLNKMTFSRYFSFGRTLVLKI